MKWVPTKVLAKRWGTTKSTVGYYIKTGALPYKRCGHKYLVPDDIKKPERKPWGKPRSSCPYSNNGTCMACDLLRIDCDGNNYINCEQYMIMSSQKRRNQS